MPDITITSSGLTETMAELVQMVRPRRRQRANKIGGRAMQQALKKYHRAKGRQLWITPGPTHGPGRKESGWWKTVALGWLQGKTTADGAEVVNDAPYFAHKVEGGTITAKRVNFLTIPIIPEAHGLTARQYAEENSVKLFTIPGVHILFRRGGNRVGDSSRSQSVVNRTVGRSRGGKRIGLEAREKITGVFALVKSVTQKPTPGALPEPAVYSEAFEKAMVDDLLAPK